MTKTIIGMLNTKLGGRYSIISRLGSGGFGETYLAEDVQLPDNHCCVVKHLKPQSTEPEVLSIARRLFDSEAKVLHRLGSHNQIPRLLANFEENHQFFLVQEFIEGHGLDQELTGSKNWSEVQVLELLQDILTTLEFVHQQKVIHRDIKPENLIRRKQDGKLILIDFGAVKQVCTQVVTGSKRVKSTITIGTSGYMPSEQANGHPQINSDIYAVGIIGIQALTGLDPEYIPRNSQTLELEWSNLVEVNPDLTRILDKMVRYDFRQRYPSATAVLKDLDSVVITFSHNLNIQPTAILVNNLSPSLNLGNQNIATNIEEISVSNQLTELDPNHPISPQPTAIESKTEIKRINTKSLTSITSISKTSGVALIGSAIAILAIISGVAVNKLYRVNDVVSAPVFDSSGQSIQNEAEEKKAEVLLQQVQIFEQVESKINNGDQLEDITILAAKIPEDSPLRNKVDTALVKYQKQWEQDKLAFNEASSAFKSKNWKNALTAYKKISNPYWQKQTKWIADKANTEIAAALAPKPVIERRFPRVVREELPVDNSYSAPPPVYYEPAPVAPEPIRQPSPSAGKFSIPEAQ